VSGRNVFRYILWAGLGALVLLATVMVVLLSGKDLAAANGQVEFTVGQKRYFTDGRVNTADVAPFIENGRTYVPVRYLAEALGASVNWEGATRTVALTKEKVEVKLVVGNNVITVNGKGRPMDAVPLIRGRRTFLPARYIAEAFGYRVSWEPRARSVVIRSALIGVLKEEGGGTEQRSWRVAGVDGGRLTDSLRFESSYGGIGGVWARFSTKDTDNTFLVVRFLLETKKGADTLDLLETKKGADTLDLQKICLTLNGRHVFFPVGAYFGSREGWGVGKIKELTVSLEPPEEEGSVAELKRVTWVAMPRGVHTWPLEEGNVRDFYGEHLIETMPLWQWSCHSTLVYVVPRHLVTENAQCEIGIIGSSQKLSFALKEALGGGSLSARGVPILDEMLRNP